MKSLLSLPRLIVRDLIYAVRLLLPPAEGGIVLAYHSIGENGAFFTVTRKSFEFQMNYLKAKKFSVVSVDQLMEYKKAGKVPARTVAITFDDGYEDFRTQAFPVLQHHHFPATVFLITGSLGELRDVRGTKLKLLSEEEVRALSASPLVTFGSHTVTHPRLTKIDAEIAEKEIKDSRAGVEANTGKTALHFAYPYGRNNEEVQSAASRAGVMYAYTTEPGSVTSESSDLALPRNGIDARTTRMAFRGILNRCRL